MACLFEQVERGRVSHLGDLGVPEGASVLVGAQRTDLIALLFEQDREVKRAVGVAALAGSPIAGLGGCLVTLLFEQHTEIGGRGGMTKPIGLLEGRHRAGVIALLFEQDREVKHAVGVAALAGSPIAGLGGCLVTLLFEQHTEIGGRGGMTKPIGLLEGRDRPDPITIQFQQGRVPERLLAVT